jgi:type III restriction enzyme
MDRPLHPPGRDIRCIVSVGMLTEGWDCNTVTHIIGMRPFQSQLLCEQVVGRGLRRASYDLDENGLMTEEVAKVFGVPFEIIPFKAQKKGDAKPKPKRFHVHAEPSRAHLEITYPRVEGFTQAVRNRITVDWADQEVVVIDPGRIPPEVEVKASLPNNQGRMSLSGPGKVDSIGLRKFRESRRLQELVFELAATLTRDWINQRGCPLPAHSLFPQMATIVRRFLDEKVAVLPPSEKIDLFLSPYYGLVIERLVEAIRPDASQGETPEIPRYEPNRGPGSTAEVDYWTSKDAREVLRSHVNYVVADTKKWEQTAAYYIDTHPLVDAFVKNAGLGFAVPYLHDGEMHDYQPDFIIRLKTEPVVSLILETKGYDEKAGVKEDAAIRWVNAVNADGKHGIWAYRIARKPSEVTDIIESFG